MKITDLMYDLGVEDRLFTQGPLAVATPIDGSEIARVAPDDDAEIDAKIRFAEKAFQSWRKVPAPRRGELVRLLGEELRAHKNALGRLVTIECGKILSEGLGEVQEMIDICDFAVGLSRQLYGLTIASERPGHHMRESWQPLGPVGVISAFNFPVAVWSWNAALALVCGDTLVWKPSEKTPLTALAVQSLLERAAQKFGDAPEGLMSVVIGGREAGERIADDKNIALVSATGSTRMGRDVGPRVARRFGRVLLELGGNNAGIVAPSADPDLALRAVCFSAAGTAGQRCTSLRRLFVHDSIYDDFVPRLKAAYQSLPVGDPLKEGTLVGPLIDKDALERMQDALARAKEQSAAVAGGERLEGEGCYVRPAIAELSDHEGVVNEETFAPILYVMRYENLEDAIALQNSVTQGLSSCIFTRDVLEAETFLSATGSDCGIANVNIGPSGAEIGGAFGGEKETGGGRESGSDAWKAYMRRQTQTVNYSTALPLAQGVKFDI
ncbi:L-piperidine-6-carboxylate dehydrogenase [Hyphococcus luteus]|uniref:aldehyde dehydrogenase (NAD(+)) n=1 Tax=Hyphococcus luteus TaxID=2058213 RepID=A0A2S7JYN8_9PROT|nr:aldehyde dehydrogenase family protein [Marinicaulis flavus]PQA85363.1 aldehyde dehydrogenase family protein [Marinicaulis flavus]